MSRNSVVSIDCSVHQSGRVTKDAIVGTFGGPPDPSVAPAASAEGDPPGGETVSTGFGTNTSSAGEAAGSPGES